MLNNEANEEYDYNALIDSAKKFRVRPVKGIERVFIDFDTSEKFCSESFERCNKKFWVDYEARKQRKNEIAIKKEVWQLLSQKLKKLFPESYLALGGSTINEFGTRDSDLDLCLAIRSPRDNIYDETLALDVLIRAKEYLEDEKFIQKIKLVPARVPILKLALNFPYNQIDVDINCNCVAGIYNSHLLSYYARIDKRVQAMVTFLKDWGRATQVIDPMYGGINSYSMMLMVIHFLQCAVDPPILPNLIQLYPNMFDGTGNVEDLQYNVPLDLPKIPKNTRSLGELMFGFLNYFSQFSYPVCGISIRYARLFNRNERPREDKRYLFFLEEAYDGLTVPKNLTDRRKLEEIVGAFRDFRDQLLIDLLGAIPPQLDYNGNGEHNSEEFKAKFEKIIRSSS